MEGSRPRGRRLLGHAARRVAGSVRDRSPSPRRRRGRRARRAPVQYRVVRPHIADGWEDAPPFEFLGTVRNARRRRSPSPPSPPVSPPPPPDPDDDPVAVGILAALPRVRFDRRERINHDVEWSGTASSFSPNWKVPIPSVVGVVRGSNYGQRATNFIRVKRLGFKVTAYRETSGGEVDFAVPPIPLGIARYSTFYFRIAVIYDKQSDGVDPSSVYPDVFAPGPSYALDTFRLPATTERYEVLHDETYRWRDGEVSLGTLIAAGEGAPFFVQTGLLGHEEFFVECDKLVHFSSDLGTAAAINSGNIFYMICCLGVAAPNFVINSRTTYSDNL